MRGRKNRYGTTIWLSANDTFDWAHRPTATWPCSTVSGKRLKVHYSPRGDLDGLTINGQYIDDDCTCEAINGLEFNACLQDHLIEKFGKAHPAVRGQWKN